MHELCLIIVCVFSHVFSFREDRTRAEPLRTRCLQCRAVGGPKKFTSNDRVAVSVGRKIRRDNYYFVFIIDSNNDNKYIIVVVTVVVIVVRFHESTGRHGPPQTRPPRSGRMIVLYIFNFFFCDNNKLKRSRRFGVGHAEVGGSFLTATFKNF